MAGLGHLVALAPMAQRPLEVAKPSPRSVLALKGPLLSGFLPED